LRCNPVSAILVANKFIACPPSGYALCSEHKWFAAIGAAQNLTGHGIPPKESLAVYKDLLHKHYFQDFKVSASGASVRF
jgi:hypothetical protein